MRSSWHSPVRWLALCLVLCALGAGAAHPDTFIVDQTFRLAPGEAAPMRMAIHYHRLVGRIATVGDAPSGVTLLVVDPETWSRYGAAAPAREARFAIVDVREAALNHLIRCCDDRAFTDFRLVMRNDGADPVEARLTAWTIHDDLAVVVDRAESGAFAFPFALFLGLSLTASWSVFRRRPGVSPRARGMPRSFWWSLGLAGAAGAIALAMGVAGVARYGAGLVDGMVAIQADVPVPGGPFGSRIALVMGVLMLTWCAAAACWARAAVRSDPEHSRPVGWLGIGIGATSLCVGALLGWTYGAYAVPVALGITLGAPLLVLGARVARRAGRGAE